MHPSKQVQIAGYSTGNSPAGLQAPACRGYFHSAVAYAILRQNGAGLGKRDCTRSVPEIGQ